MAALRGIRLPDARYERNVQPFAFFLGPVTFVLASTLQSGEALSGGVNSCPWG